MIVLIAQIVLGISLAGILVLLFSKTPVLSRITEQGEIAEESIVSKTKNGARFQLKRFSSYPFLEKILLKLRSLILRSDEKVSRWSEKVRKKNGKSDKYRDDYWDQLKGG